jgi:hypothetical protein
MDYQLISPNKALQRTPANGAAELQRYASKE